MCDTRHTDERAVAGVQPAPEEARQERHEREAERDVEVEGGEDEVRGDDRRPVAAGAAEELLERALERAADEELLQRRMERVDRGHHAAASRCPRPGTAAMFSAANGSKTGLSATPLGDAEEQPLERHDDGAERDRQDDALDAPRAASRGW